MYRAVCAWCGKKLTQGSPKCRLVTPKFKKRNAKLTSKEEKCSESRRLEFNGLVFVGVDKSPPVRFCSKNHRRLWQTRKKEELREKANLSAKGVEALQMQVATLEFSYLAVSNS